MDIHRCRFVPFPASPINAVAFSHTSLPSLKASHLRQVEVRLAVGRANGDIEIWNPADGIWHQELIIPGGKDRSIDGLVWVTEPDEETADGKIIVGRSRLFSIGYTTTVTEWDLEKATAKRHATGTHGDIWCLAAQPPSATGEQATRRLVAGTSDGSLLLYSIEDDDLRFQRAIVKTPKKKINMVSLTFQSRHVVIVGCSDSTIRAYDIRNGSVLRQMTLGSDLAGGSRDIIVWSVKCLRNGDIVSGDSTGQICIWDGKTYTQAQRIQSHTQDVLSLATSADGKRIVSGGMDRRTVLYEPMPGQPGRWAKMWHRRYHTHDVKAMASFEGKGMSVVVSGGPDATPVVIPLRGAGKENHRTLSHLPQSLAVQSAPKARLILSWWGREVHLWQIRRPVKDLLDATEDLNPAKNHKLLGRILVKGESNITSASISEKGDLLVVATGSEVKAFHLRLGANGLDPELKINKVEVPSADHGAIKVQISPDASWVSWVQEGSKVMIANVTAFGTASNPSYTISPPSKLRRLRRDISKYTLLGGLGAYNRHVGHIAFSADSKMLAVADLAGYVDTWVLRGAKESNGADDSSSASSSDSSDSEDEDTTSTSTRWVRNPKAALMPKLPAVPVSLSFATNSIKGNDADDYTLLAITTTWQILTFNPLRGALTAWSKRNPHARIPEQFRKTKDVVKGTLWQGSRVWMYGVSFVFMLDLSEDLTPEKATSLIKHGDNKGIKRKRDGTQSGAGDRMEKHSLAPQTVRVLVDADKNEWMDIDNNDADDHRSRATSSGLEDDDDDDEDTDGGELLHMRDEQGPNGNGTLEKRDLKTKYWHTYKYRPILGIVPLQSEDGLREDVESALPPLEVALVERPIWDVDLPPRYFADGEWER
ncbi:WD40 repeat-like protein [Coniochaeta hoffmannii]|uniref:WD40 repeat-like protein n=1 Tax=Coniochaeta hoffmannii TaxID=91930 RepID=A0AA38RWE3_9PEZI|nr:WD40 repeat-like protein [Coniochaeta hoffmannii]